MDLGEIFLIASLILTIIHFIASLFSRMRIGKMALIGSAIFISLALLKLMYYFIIKDFNVLYVYRYSDLDLSLIYTISAVWAGREGSLLLWLFFICIMNLVSFHLTKDRIATVITSFFYLILLIYLILFSNPFIRLPFTPPHGLGLNPLLRTVEMVIHPPMIFLAYSSLVISFSIALSYVYRGKDWIKGVRPWLLLTWIFLTIGIYVGMVWAYKVLGWGGFWAWDPVENSSLLIWLAITALLHGMIVERRSGALKSFNYALLILSFNMMMFAAFITRSGLIASVHAFIENDAGIIYLILAFIFTGLALMIKQKQKTTNKKSYNNLTFKDNLLLITIILFLILTFAVFLGTLATVNFNVNREYYEMILLPILFVLLILYGLYWYRRGSLVLSIFVGLLIFALTKALIISVAIAVVTFALVGQRNVIHLGISVLFVGLIGAWIYEESYQINLDVGESKIVDSIMVKLLDVGIINNETLVAEILVNYHGNEYIMYPMIEFYKRPNSLIPVVDIVSTPLRDIYVAIVGINPLYFEIHVIPLMTFVWIGMSLLVLGGILRFKF